MCCCALPAICKSYEQQCIWGGGGYICWGKTTAIKMEAENTIEATSHRTAHCHYSDEELKSRPSPTSPWACVVYHYDSSGAWLHRKYVCIPTTESLRLASLVWCDVMLVPNSSSQYVRLVGVCRFLRVSSV